MLIEANTLRLNSDYDGPEGLAACVVMLLEKEVTFLSRGLCHVCCKLKALID